MCGRGRVGQRGVSLGPASPALWDLTDELPQVGSPGKSLEPYYDFIGNCSPPLPFPSLPAAGRQPHSRPHPSGEHLSPPPWRCLAGPPAPPWRGRLRVEGEEAKTG